MKVQQQVTDPTTKDSILYSPEADNKSHFRKDVFQLFFGGFIWNVPH